MVWLVFDVRAVNRCGTDGTLASLVPDALVVHWALPREVLARMVGTSRVRVLALPDSVVAKRSTLFNHSIQVHKGSWPSYHLVRTGN